MAEKNNNYILIGMPGSGKSTIGVLLAKALGYDFVDTDLVIQQKGGGLLKEIIARIGNDGFKQLEEDVNASIDVNKSVIAPGGSAVYSLSLIHIIMDSRVEQPTMQLISEDVLLDLFCQCFCTCWAV